MAHHFPVKANISALRCAPVPARYPAVSVILSVDPRLCWNGIKPNGINNMQAARINHTDRVATVRRTAVGLKA